MKNVEAKLSLFLIGGKGKSCWLVTLPFHESRHLPWIPEPIPDNLALAPKGFRRLQTGGKDTIYECGLKMACDKHNSFRNQIVIFLLRNNSLLYFSESSNDIKLAPGTVLCSWARGMLKSLKEKSGKGLTGRKQVLRSNR